MFRRLLLCTSIYKITYCYSIQRVYINVKHQNSQYILYNFVDKILKRDKIYIEVKEMSKSVYSLVLIDELVDKVDREAYALNTNRSNLINRIIAEHFSIATPEQKLREIFEIVENRLKEADELKIKAQQSDATMSVHSALKYKYNPTIRYSIELYKEREDVVGELKVSFRTQNKHLISDITTFFMLWAKMEKKYIEKYFPEKQVLLQIKDGKLIRKFIVPKEERYRTNDQIGKAITKYIESLDRIIKIYFNDIDDLQLAKIEMENAYIEYLNNEAIII